jgi:hypothetical protein
MKKLVLCLSLVLSGTVSQAQEPAAVVNQVFAPRRIIKVNLVGYAMLSINANYEQKVGARTSVGLLAGYKIPSFYTVDAIGNLDGENQTYTGEIEPKGLFINPYFRYYTGKALTGFYLEAFTRYYDYTFLLPYDYVKNGQNIRANMDGTASGFGGGLGLGVQFKLAPRIYLDINGGLGVASGNVHMETHDPNLDASDYQTIKRNIEQYQEDADVRIAFMDKTISSLVAGANETSAWADIENELFPIMRGGIAIGFAF